MTTQTAEQGAPGTDVPVLLGGFAALAESEWMGAAQALDVLEPLRVGGPPQRLRFPRWPRLQLLGVLTRELTVPAATVVLMVSFFVSALLGAVRQVLFNVQCGAGVEANAYYAAFRLPDTLFSLIAGGALSSAMIPVLLSTTREEASRPDGGSRTSSSPASWRSSRWWCCLVSLRLRSSSGTSWLPVSMPRPAGSP